MITLISQATGYVGAQEGGKELAFPVKHEWRLTITVLQGSNQWRPRRGLDLKQTSPFQERD